MNNKLSLFQKLEGCDDIKWLKTVFDCIEYLILIFDWKKTRVS